MQCPRDADCALLTCCVRLVVTILDSNHTRATEVSGAQICEKDLKLLSILGSGASSKVYKALLCKQGQSTPPRFVAVKKISNLDEVRQHQATLLHLCSFYYS